MMNNKKIELPINKFYYYSFPKLAVLVTTINSKGNPNIITVAWHSPVSIKPPYYGISIAPTRYSHKLILESQEFVVNFASFELVDKLHYCGKHTGRKINKFDTAKLTPLQALKLRSPLIAECYAHIECKLVEHQVYGDHTWFVGEVVACSSDPEIFIEREYILEPRINPIYYVGADTYTTVDNNKRVRKK